MQSIKAINNAFVKDRRIPLVLLSGGLDSTFLVGELLRTMPVETIYVKSSQAERKTSTELYARQNIFKYFKEKRILAITEDTVIDIGNNIVNDQRLGQPLSWFFAAMTHYDSTKHSCVCIAYVTGDSVCQHLDKIRTAWDNMSAVVKLEHIPLMFPLKDMRKHHILQEIEPELEELTVVCEIPDKVAGHDIITQCGKCFSCTTSGLEKQRVRFLNSFK